MIRYLEHNAIDKEKWDKCLASSPQGLVYSQSWFLDIVCPGWEALVEDDHSAIFPLTKRKKAGISYLFQPNFTQQLGLFTRDQIVSEKKLKEFLSAIPENFKLVEIQLNSENEILDAYPFSANRKVTHHLSLSDSIEHIRKNYSENIVRNIKKARSSELTISKNVFPADVVLLFRQNKGSTIKNLRTDDYDLLEKLISEAQQRDLLDCRGALNSENDLIAGAFFLKSFHSHIFLFSATNAEAKEKSAMSLLIDSFISDHSGEESLLDFEGSMDKNLARFYKSFGSKEVVYLQLLKNKLPIILRWLK